MAYAVFFIVAMTSMAAVLCAMVIWRTRTAPKIILSELSFSEVVQDLGRHAGRSPLDKEPERSYFTELIEGVGEFMSLYKIAVSGLEEPVPKNCIDTFDEIHNSICVSCREFMALLSVRRPVREDISAGLKHLLSFVKTAKSYITKFTLAVASLDESGLSEDADALAAEIHDFCKIVSHYQNL